MGLKSHSLFGSAEGKLRPDFFLNEDQVEKSVAGEEEAEVEDEEKK